MKTHNSRMHKKKKEIELTYADWEKCSNQM